MIGLLFPLALQAAAAAPATAADALQPIGRQQLPAKGCAAFLWSVADRQLVAMAQGDPTLLRIAPGGRTLDLPRDASAAAVAGEFGLPATGIYRAGDLTITTDLQIVRDPALTGGAKVPSGSLRIDRAGRDSVVMPVAGLIGCAGA